MSLDELRATAEAATHEGWHDRDLPSPGVVLALIEVAEAARNLVEYYPSHGDAPLRAALDKLR